MNMIHHIERGPLDGDDCYADVHFNFLKGLPRIRRIVAPHTEELAINEVLGVFGRPEYPLTEKMIQMLQGLPVLDIGGHVGTASVYFEELLSPSEIVIYEPNPKACEYIAKNVPLATVHQQAVSNAAGVSQFYFREPWFTSGMFQNSPELPRGVTVSDVQVVTGIEAIEGVPGEIGVLKIDVESSDWNALYPMRSQLNRVCVVFMEYHNETLRRAIDLLLGDFYLFHAHTCDFELAPWGQGTVGYINKRCLNPLFK